MGLEGMTKDVEGGLSVILTLYIPNGICRERVRDAPFFFFLLPVLSLGSLSLSHPKIHLKSTQNLCSLSIRTCSSRVQARRSSGLIQFQDPKLGFVWTWGFCSKPIQVGDILLFLSDLGMICYI